MQPNIPKRPRAFVVKNCIKCGVERGPDGFVKTKSWFYPDGHLPICNTCLEHYLVAQEFSWDAVDKICQYADLPFVPAEFERLHEMNGDKVFPIYAAIFEQAAYDNLGWGDYFKEFRRLREENAIDNELPEIREANRRKMREKWGGNYSDEDIFYLENLFNGILTTQNVNGALQADQAIKVCKISLEIDSALRAGLPIDKLLGAYDKMVKAAEFTPRNVKNINDFDTMGELVKWFEKKGWRNRFYDNVTRDIVDETIKNLQAFNQRLYTNETGIGDEITRRIEALKSTAELESHYDIVQNYDVDEFDNAGYVGLMSDDDEFEVELERGD